MKRLGVVVLTLGLGLAPACLAAGGEYFDVLGHEIARYAVAHAKIDAARAIEIARGPAGDSPFATIELVMDGPRPIYEVIFISPTGPRELELDAVTGKPIPLPGQTAAYDERPAGDLIRAALSHARIDLRRAMAIASDKVKGCAVVRAQAKLDGEAMRFDVEVLDDSAFKTVSVSSDGVVQQVAPSADEPGGRCWTFDNEPEGQSPAGWLLCFTHPEEGKAHWTVTHDKKPMTGPNSLQLIAESGRPVYNLALAKGTSYSDVDVRARLRPNSGKVDQGGGVVWRCKDADNYYICRFNPLENNFRVYSVIDGRRHQLQSVDVATEPGKWRAVRAKMIGDHIMCFLDGKKLLDVHDDAISAPGMIGLWTKADASSSFDNVAVRNGVAAETDDDDG